MRKPSKKIILAMIKDDLLNTKLVSGLNKLGLHADDYTLYASVNILNFMGLTSKGNPLGWEKIHDNYMNKRGQVCQFEVFYSQTLIDALAEEIYQYLKGERKMAKKTISTER